MPDILISAITSADPTTDTDLIGNIGVNTRRFTINQAVSQWIAATGDILYATGSSNSTRLPIGGAGRILQSTDGIPAWVIPSNLTTIANPTSESVLRYDTTNSVWAPVTIDPNELLRVSTLGVLEVIAAPSAGSILAYTTATGSSAAQWLAATSGEVLIGSSLGAAEFSSAIFVDTSQNVGIGTTDPSVKLEVHGNLTVTEGTSQLNVSFIGGGATHSFVILTDGSLNWDVAANEKMTIRDQGGVELFSFSSVGAVFNEGGLAGPDLRMESNLTTNIFYLNSGTDKIGIGTSSPNSLLEVAGTFLVSGISTFTAAMAITEKLTLSSNLSVGVNTTLTGTLHVGGATTIVGIFNASEKAILSSNLSVGGATTITGKLVVGSSIEVTGGIKRGTTDYAGIGIGTSGQVLKTTGGIPAWDDPTGCVLGSSASQAFTSASFQAIAWSVELLDSDGFHSTATASTRIILPTSGLYSFTFNGHFQAATSRIVVSIGDGAGANVFAQQATTVDDVHLQGRLSVTGLSYQATAGSTIIVAVFSDDASTLVVDNLTPQFTAHRIL